MQSFKEFSKQKPLLEGGNVIIGDVAAERLDLKKFDRDKIVVSIGKGLKGFSDAFQKFSGVPLWSDELMKSLLHLSGSAKHFFDVNSIQTSDFVTFKSSVGDIDTQIDGSLAPIVKKFLDSLSPGTVFNKSLEWVGYKTSADQFITLFKIKEFDNHPIQVDLEHVEYINGVPTKWSEFSHSSAFEDLKLGIKGAFQKLLFRSIVAKDTMTVVILKGAKKTPTVVDATPLVASLKGIRKRLQAVIDPDTGKQQMHNGLGVFTELPSKGAEYQNDLEVFFSMLFNGKKATKQDLDLLMSFKGMIELMKQNLSATENKKIMDRFVEILFGKGAQGLYRGDRLHDFRDKTVALRYISKQLGIMWKEYLPTIISYYRNYR